MPAVASYAPRGQPTRNPNRQRPQRVQLFRNDNWPPRPPALDLPVPSFLTKSPDSDTLLRALPTPSFVSPADFADAAMDVERIVESNPPAKTAPAPVPTQAVIAASAIPLAQWFADVVWAIYRRTSTLCTTGGNSGLANADKAPESLVSFSHQVLSQTLASPQCAALGLYYLVRLPVNLSSVSNVRIGGALWTVGSDPDGHTTYTSVPDRERAARAAFVAELYGQGVGPGEKQVPERLAALALMLGNKWLDDHTFTNKTWHDVTHLPLARLTALEHRALECFNHMLGVADSDWRSWLGVLRDEALQAAMALGDNNALSLLAIDTLDRLEREREVLIHGVGAGNTISKGVIGDRRPAPIDIEDELEMAQVEIDIDLDDGGPVPDELRRPVKVRFAAESVEEWGHAIKGDWSEDWDRARDPPVERNTIRGGYEAVERPAKKKFVEEEEMYEHAYEYAPPGYDAIPRDAMRYDHTHAFDCPGYEYAGRCYGCVYIPRQVPVWAPRAPQPVVHHRGSSGCILS